MPPHKFPPIPRTGIGKQITPETLPVAAAR